jgi:hypothetical protein
MSESISIVSNKQALLGLHAKVPAEQFVRMLGLTDFVDDMKDGSLTSVLVADASRAPLLASLKVMNECNSALGQQAVNSLDLSFAFMAYSQFFVREREKELFAHLHGLTDANGQLAPIVVRAPSSHTVSTRPPGVRYNKSAFQNIRFGNQGKSDHERFEAAKAREIELVELVLLALTKKRESNALGSACPVVVEAGH